MPTLDQPTNRQLQYLVHRIAADHGIRTLYVRAAFLDPDTHTFDLYQDTVMNALRHSGARLLEQPIIGTLVRGRLPALVAFNLCYDPVISDQAIGHRLAQLNTRLRPRYSGVASIEPSIETGTPLLTCRANLELRYGQFRFDPDFASSKGLVCVAGPERTYRLEFRLEQAAVSGPEMLCAAFQQAADSLGVCLDRFEQPDATRRVLRLPR